MPRALLLILALSIPALADAPPADGWRRHVLDDPLPWRAVFVGGADLDGDGDTDVVAGGWWYRNPGGLQQPWPRQAIGDGFHNFALAADFDDDGDTDLLGTAGKPNGGTFFLARNDGRGGFALTRIAELEGDFLQGVARLQPRPGVTPAVALSWHNGAGGTTLLMPPTDPLGVWGLETLTETTQQEDLSAGDIDGDGRVDLLLGTIWLHNPGAPETPWPAHTLGEVTAGEPDRSDLADIDGDGDLDAVVGLENGTDLLWFEAPDDPTGPWTRHVVAGGVGGGFSMDVGDIDGDGDPDIVLGEHRAADQRNRVLWYENTGAPAHWPAHAIDPGSEGFDHHDGTQLVDLDSDGDLDLVSIGWYNPRVVVYENPAARTPAEGGMETITIGGETLQGRLIARETFTDADDWAVEQQPGATFDVRDGRLHFVSRDKLGTTAWYRRELPADVLVRYKARAIAPHDAANLNAFLAAREPDGGELQFTRDGDYKSYHSIPNYIFTFTAPRPERPEVGWSRLRRDPGFELVNERMDAKSETGPVYDIAWAKRGGRLQVWVDGELIHDYTDPDPHGAGKFGFRTWSTEAEIWDVEFWAL